MYSVVTLQAGLAIMCWLVVSVGAGFAVFTPRIQDILSERIGLVVVSIAAAGTAYRIAQVGEISEGGLTLAIGMAWYVLALVWKHWHHLDGDASDKKELKA